MADIPISLTGADYARVMPLATGDVKPEGIALTLMTEDPARKRRPDQGSPQHPAWVRPRCEPSRNVGCCGPDRS
jgi:hypothetical protein